VKKFMAVVVLLAILAGGLYLFFKTDIFDGLLSTEELEDTVPVVNMAALQEQVLPIGELATIEYNYTTVISSTTSLKFKNVKVPFTTNRIIVALDGTMKIGIDVSKISIDGSESSQTVTITIPKPVVQDHYTIEETLRVLDEKKNIFNPVTIEDYTKLSVAEKKKMEEKARKDGLFERAEEEAVKIITQFAGGFVPEDYTVEVVVAKAAA